VFKTRITKMFGIEYPLIQGAMLWLARAELASAVSNAGGLGIISSATFPTVKELRQEIRKAKSMTDKPFVVNFTFLPTFRPVNHEEYINAAIEEGVNIIETAGRSPEPYMRLLKDAKVTVMHKCARVRDAKTAERLRVDAVTIVGFEAGGVPGMEDVTSLVRIPLAVDTVKIPVIAGGGIADGRGLVAALALGAEGVMMGTRFMASQECLAHPKIKEWMVQAAEKDTVMINRSFNNPERVLKTVLSLKILEMEEKGATLEELLPMITGLRGKEALEEGDINKGVIACGQIVGLIHDVPSVKEIIGNIISEAKAVEQRLQNRGILA
jgi:NAD(P)H-dependent flavin oxidoreductase YrpB (nitropropane dioxygenase family)